MENTVRTVVLRILRQNIGFDVSPEAEINWCEIFGKLLLKLECMLKMIDFQEALAEKVLLARCWRASLMTSSREKLLKLRRR